MIEVDAPDKAPGTVTQVLQAGYVIHDRLLREALVAVAKGAAPAQPKLDESA
jgi:molecular chaperone GrpE